MKRITQSIEYEGTNHQALINALKDFFDQEPFANGFDWQHQYLWATMTDEQSMMFLLKHPEFIGRFTTV
jgi:hypothetical protein